MSTLINIGLARNGAPNLSPAHAAAALYTVGGARVHRANVWTSDTEPTLVAEVDRPLTAAAAYALATSLGQDAIAQWDGREGALYGPNVHAWGEFDPEFFVTLDGHRLAPEGVRKAA